MLYWNLHRLSLDINSTFRHKCHRTNEHSTTQQDCSSPSPTAPADNPKATSAFSDATQSLSTKFLASRQSPRILPISCRTPTNVKTHPSFKLQLESVYNFQGLLIQVRKILINIVTPVIYFCKRRRHFWNQTFQRDTLSVLRSVTEKWYEVMRPIFYKTLSWTYSSFNTFVMCKNDVSCVTYTRSSCS